MYKNPKPLAACMCMGDPGSALLPLLLPRCLWSLGCAAAASLRGQVVV